VTPALAPDGRSLSAGSERYWPVGPAAAEELAAVPVAEVAVAAEGVAFGWLCSHVLIVVVIAFTAEETAAAGVVVVAVDWLELAAVVVEAVEVVVVGVVVAVVVAGVAEVCVGAVGRQWIGLTGATVPVAVVAWGGPVGPAWIGLTVRTGVTAALVLGSGCAGEVGRGCSLTGVVAPEVALVTTVGRVGCGWLRRVGRAVVVVVGVCAAAGAVTGVGADDAVVVFGGGVEVEDEAGTVVVEDVEAVAAVG
jgi:hypothetical protein